MQFSVTQALFCLLSLSPAICSAKPYARHSAPATLNALNSSDSDVTNGYHGPAANQHTPWIKRVPAPPVVLSKKPQWGDTWFGYVQEPPNSGWTAGTIRTMTQDAHESRKSQHPDRFVIAAVWVPDVGVWFGSTVQGVGHNTMKAQAPLLAPRLWAEIKDRKLTGLSQSPNPALFHAEDAVLFWRESGQGHGAQLDPYSCGTQMYIYGFRGPTEQPKRLDPCGGDQASIKPSCYEVVRPGLDLILI
ncbi:hypothetical protein CC86DRAFT_385645 [Ophiobolus disseminans]|uniref:Uncharacterized protein n=1 Tax=Ophiobolus disseminans TaxID=1469910 RepID=A0A6A6ZNS7_9PLEO|nr:hypothetical protein CC86DRAFT_385645 [Ophiobolus disseminans]